MRGLVVLVVIACGLAACGSSRRTIEAVPVPPGATVGLTSRDGPRQLSVLEEGDCTRLQVEARGRRYLTEAACPYDPFGSRLLVQEPELNFNDREVHLSPCPDDCAPGPPDVRLSAPVVWGRAAPEAGFVCVDRGDADPVVVEPRSDGLVLTPVPGVTLDPGDNVLSFLADGRFIGTPGVPSTEQPAGVARCLTALAGRGAASPAASRAWPFRIDIPPALADSDVGLSISTDTGYAPDGASLQVIAQGYRIVLRLHPDTTRLAVTLEAPGHSAVFPLPQRIRAALAEPGGCAVWRLTLVLRLDPDLTPHLGVSDNGRTC